MNWKPVPLYRFETNGGEVHLLPTDRELISLEEGKRALETKYEELLSSKDKRDKIKLEALKNAIAQADENFQLMKKTIEKIRPTCEKKDYHLAYPDFGTYLEAEEESKDWVAGEPRVNEAQLTKRLMANHVRLGEKVLDETAVKELDLIEGNALWQEFKSMIFPNAQRLPFMSLPSTTS